LNERNASNPETVVIDYRGFVVVNGWKEEKVLLTKTKSEQRLIISKILKMFISVWWK